MKLLYWVREHHAAAKPKSGRLRATAAVAIAAAVTLAGCSTTSSTSTAGSTTNAAPSNQSNAASTPLPASPTNAASSTTCSTKGAPSSNGGAVANAQKLVDKAAGLTTKWDGPTTPAKAPKNKTVVFIAANANNTGDIGVYKGLQQAAGSLGWTVKFIDGQNSTSTNLNAISQAIALHPDAIGLSSFDAASAESLIEQAKKAGIVVVGNHTGESTGVQASYPGMFTNISSDPRLISQVAAACAVVASNGTAGVTIYNCGTEFKLCGTKQDGLTSEINTCSGCKILALNEFPFEAVPQQMAGLATSDYQRFGSKLTYMLAINDLYWDAAVPALQAAGVGPGGPPAMIAAGDGSPAAYSRIRKGQYQIASVAEPLNEHGWQMADEITRALDGLQPSAFVTYPHLVTIENVNLEGGDKGTFDPANGYRNEYAKLWGIGG